MEGSRFAGLAMFRGKRTDGQGWAFGDLHHVAGRLYVVDESKGFEVVPETGGALVGKDADGRDYYEGDVLSRDDDRGLPRGRPEIDGYEEPFLWAVGYDPNEKEFRLYGWDGFEGCLEPDMTFASSLRVVGNVHEWRGR